MKNTTALLVLSLLVSIPAQAEVDLRDRGQVNRLGNVPAQCFTRTQDEPGGPVQNPCYVCHSDARAPNFAATPELQLAYDFPQIRGGTDIVNDWTNLFVDRRVAIATIDDAAMLRYVRTDNYHGKSGSIDLADRLASDALPENWDVDGNGRWDGYVPDAAFQFDDEGFDIDPDGNPTGWRAYGYYPFPGAFMPTNGAFDDVLIRLPADFRENDEGKPDRQIYRTNLAIVEALIRRADVAIDATDEAALGVDLDRDGQLGIATRVRYDWAPTEGREMSWVGRARSTHADGKLRPLAGLFPRGTEFLHSVRYLDIADDGRVAPAARMKELRYAVKRHALSWSELKLQALDEEKEAAINPDRREIVLGDAERGMDNSLGWRYQGFIENADGRLRPQSYDESSFCVGCHRGVSSTEDGNFSFVRKRSDGPGQGWGDWGRKPYDGLADPLDQDGKGVFAHYLEVNRAGDEFRSNDEVQSRFFDAKGAPRADAFAALETDLSTLLLPSRERAQALNKAYWLIVQEQSFVHGRDPVIAPAKNVMQQVELGRETGIAAPLPTPYLQP